MRKIQIFNGKIYKNRSFQFENCDLKVIVNVNGYMKATVSPAITMLTIDISLMRMLSDGPLVSLNGSPTVSPTMVAL